MAFDLPSAAPDGMAPLVGFREWLVRPGIDPELWSVFHPTEWPVGHALRAVCLRPTTWPIQGPLVHRNTPDSSCACGIHAFRDPAFDDLRGRQGFMVRGAVFGWGRYVIGERGWRAELCRPAALEEPEDDSGTGGHLHLVDLVARLASRHAIPLVHDLRNVRFGAFLAETSDPLP
jgi:hypothetical protein